MPKVKADQKTPVASVDFAPKKEYIQNKYYLAVSEKYRMAKLLTLALFIVYLIVMLSFYRNSITYDNLTYLIKDIDTKVGNSALEFTEVRYDEQDKMDFAIYKDHLALAGTSSFELFNTAGKPELDVSNLMENPVVRASEKYVLVYDLGSTGYSVYTNLAKICSGASPYEIHGAAVSDSGKYLLITLSNESKYVVNVYDSNFKSLCNYYKDKYVIDADIDDNGENILIASVDAANNELDCEIVFGKIGSDDFKTIILTGSMPLRAQFFDNGAFIVICDDVLVFFDKNGNQTLSYPISDMTLSRTDISDERVLIVGSTNTLANNNTLVVLNESGQEIYKDTVNLKIADAVLGSKDLIFILSDNEVLRINDDKKTDRIPYSGHGDKLLAFDDYALVCCDSRTYAVFKDFESIDSEGVETK